MDPASVLSVAVAMIITLCGYLLFNDLPRFGRPGPRSRRGR